MKHTIILLAFVLCSVASYSQRVMTQEEKYSLVSNTTFQEKCKQSIRDFAVYWSAHDGSGFSTETERITWAKNRLMSVSLLKNPIISEDPTTIGWFFLNAGKGKTYNLSAAPVSVETLLSAWDSASTQGALDAIL